jgi:hypothetical protein
MIFSCVKTLFFASLYPLHMKESVLAGCPSAARKELIHEDAKALFRE